MRERNMRNAHLRSRHGNCRVNQERAVYPCRESARFLRQRGYTMSSKTPKPDLAYPDTVWLELVEAAFLEDSGLAERAARFLQYLLAQIESGPEGITNARHYLEHAISLSFPFTLTYKSCRDSFESSLREVKQKKKR